MVFITLRRLLICTLFSLVLFHLDATAQTHTYYQEPTWKPRAVLPYDDAINNDFWPKSPEVKLTYNDPTFDKSRLSEVPAPGIYPRVLLTPKDVEAIRNKVALGDKAPLAFRSMWQRVTNSKSAFYALVTKDDALGKQLAKELVAKIKSLDPKITALDKQADRDNLWAAERSVVASGNPDPPSEIWDLLDYDYLHDWMTPEEQQAANDIIARICKHRISNFLMVPDHYMINNHEGFGMEYIRLMLLIEGQKGFDQKLFDLACHKANAMLSWYLDKDGMCYESIKGWLNIAAFTAVGLRQRNLLMHDHLQAKMYFFRAAIRWEDGVWHIRDEMRASAFHVIWMMHYYHPKDEYIDFLYQSTFSTHPFLTDPNAKWPNPVGICNELLLLYADDGIVNNGKKIDWTDQDNINRLHLPTTWQDSMRGYVDVRNSWKKEDLHVGFVCKQDFFYGGHEGSENNRLTLWKDGVNWIQDNNMLATKATFLQNMLTIDGKGCHWPPAPGTWLGIHETATGVVAVGDGKNGYSFYKSMQVHPLAFPSAKLPYYAPFAEGNFDLDRNIQVAFHPGTIRYTDGFAHTDYGPWSGETRLVEGYRPWNTMEQAYRTVQVAKGDNPYVLVIDDAKKDNQLHQFDWNISVPVDAVLADVSTPEVQFQNTEPSDNRMDDIVLAKGDIAKDAKTGKLLLKKGDPLCLIRVLWRKTDYGFPVPKLEKFEGYALVTIPARAVSPEFKVLVYPYKYGEEVPKTTWNRDRTQLTVEFKNQKDVYNFSTTDGGRTVFELKRNGKEAATSKAKPARPNLIVRGETFNQNDLRYTRNADKVPTYLVCDSLHIQLQRVAAPAQIHYTLDGTEPTAASPLYERDIVVKNTCTLKAKTIDPTWEAGAKESETFTAKFVATPAEQPMAQEPKGTKGALLARVYEINTKLYNDKGFFDAKRIMMPDVAKEKPIMTTATNGFVLPEVTPTHPLEEQCKGFYRFSGYFFAKEKGVYTFDINSCGPVLFELGKQTVIEATGVFHQNQAHRKGEASFDKGWHYLNLVVCDPLFWNINSLDPMPLEVTYAINGGEYQSVKDEELKYNNDLNDGNDKNDVLSSIPSSKELTALSNVPLLEPGLDLAIYDRSGKRRDNDFLDIDDGTPIHSERTNLMEATSSRNTVRVYNGYFYAPIDGNYSFKLPMRNGESGPLGALQASCQNQLRIDNDVIAQRGVYGRYLNGKVALAQGWHTISLRYGPSEPTCKVVFPDGQTVDLNGENLSRPSLVSILPEGKPTALTLYEIYNPAKFALDFKGDKKAEIHYTLDGTVPSASSPIYTAPFTVNNTTTINASVFSDGKAVTLPAKMEVKLVKLPEAGSMGQLTFDKWDGHSTDYPVDGRYKIWLTPGTTLAQGMHGNKAFSTQGIVINPNSSVDANVSHNVTKGGFKMYEMRMRDNALTIGVWFKTDTLTGKIFTREGGSAFGKTIKTVSCVFNNGTLRVEPNRIMSGKIVKGEWQFVLVTADEKSMAVYLNGTQVGTSIGTKDITTDALDFFVGTPAIIDNLQIFDRLLQPDEVKRLYEAGKK